MVLRFTYGVAALQLPDKKGSIGVKAGEDDGSVLSIIRHHLSSNEEVQHSFKPNY